MPLSSPALAPLYSTLTGQGLSRVMVLAGDGSRRRMVRLYDAAGDSVVAVFGPDKKENRAFIGFSEAFRSIGLPVPEVLAADEDAGVYIVEDLGDQTLFHALDDARTPADPFPVAIRAYFERALEILPRFQVEGAKVVDFGLAHPRAEFDRQAMMWDLQSFKYQFLKLARIAFDETLLEHDLERFTASLLSAARDVFCYRDFQARNVMLRDGEPWFIDYQGGRLGSPHYDVASMLYSGKTALPDEARRELLEHYLEALAEHRPVDRDVFHAHYRRFVLLRIFQAMGVYGLLGLHERKLHFEKSIPPAARNLRALLADDVLADTPELARVVGRVVERFADADAPPGNTLTVRIASFSYKHGVPVDPGGHGGGFVFDCRALPNPGRLPEFLRFSGRDVKVIEWLERHPEVEAFFERAYGLVDAHVRTYLERGFTSLHVLFGCTGGQHRSVYMAGQMARRLRDAFSEIDMTLTHRENDRWPGV